MRGRRPAGPGTGSTIAFADGPAHPKAGRPEPAACRRRSTPVGNDRLGQQALELALVERSGDRRVGQPGLELGQVASAAVALMLPPGAKPRRAPCTPPPAGLAGCLLGTFLLGLARAWIASRVIRRAWMRQMTRPRHAGRPGRRGRSRPDAGCTLRVSASRCANAPVGDQLHQAADLEVAAGVVGIDDQQADLEVGLPGCGPCAAPGWR